MNFLEKLQAYAEDLGTGLCENSSEYCEIVSEEGVLKLVKNTPSGARTLIEYNAPEFEQQDDNNDSADIISGFISDMIKSNDANLNQSLRLAFFKFCQCHAMQHLLPQTYKITGFGENGFKEYKLPLSTEYVTINVVIGLDKPVWNCYNAQLGTFAIEPK